MIYEYTVIRSDRKTIALEISQDLKLLIRAPRICPMEYIESFAKKHSDWIEKNMEIQRRRQIARPVLSSEEQVMLISRAKQEIPPIVFRYAEVMGLTPSNVKITSAQKRFGSCSSKNSLCFSYRLLLYPMEAVEYVVVHELAHIVHKNHGSEFYALIEKILPDYRIRNSMLKE